MRTRALVVKWISRDASDVVFRVRILARAIDGNITVVYTSVMKTLISIKIDRDTKTRAQMVAKDIGLPLSTLVNAYLKQFVREKRVDFALPLRPNKKTAKLLDRGRTDYKKGRNIAGPFATAEDMEAYLNS